MNYGTVKDIVRPGQTLSAHGMSKRAGGKGANQAVAVAKAGSSVGLVGAVGEDGRWVVEYLKESRVDVSDIEVVSVGIPFSLPPEDSHSLFRNLPVGL